MLWKKLDGCEVNGGKMRVSFSSPGRLAATHFGGQSAQNFVSFSTANLMQDELKLPG